MTSEVENFEEIAESKEIIAEKINRIKMKMVDLTMQ